LSISSIPLFVQSSVAGYENLVVWADLLDTINVFPVADGDTGTNLRVSLSPLRDCEQAFSACVARLTSAGVGNSGNIAAAFLREFLKRDVDGLAIQTAKGREQAYLAIQQPKSGTMLDVFDALCLVFEQAANEKVEFYKVRKGLQQSVVNTMNCLPLLQEAGVVDSGALAMFLFFDGFFQYYLQKERTPTPVMELFAGKLSISSSYHTKSTGEYCVEATLATDDSETGLTDKIASLGKSAVIVRDNGETKLHLHTKNPERLRENLAALGDVVNWSDEAIDPMLDSFGEDSFYDNTIRILCDAAGSLPLPLARQHGVILLDSYIVTTEQALPESLYSPAKLYALMRQGVKVSTAQASNSERYLHYQASVAQHKQILYLSAGSAFTGNYAVACSWQEKSKSRDAFIVLDSGAASARLAVIALLTARYAETGASVKDVVSFAKTRSNDVEELVFIDDLQYLVAGGRISKTKAFFAGLMHMKPVVSPWFDGVRKLGVVRSQKSQIAFALDHLKQYKQRVADPLILLQYSDNKEWLQELVEPQVRKLLPKSEILLVPLSLTSGVHMGPGTWSVAYG
jgi:DegV family protein with EDD domain